ncbi:MAG TPA: BON domain-containing protein [Vicinamibacterales bacterium]|nr:BON domain-containing protein [Vicinamibacterales bacterium]
MTQGLLNRASDMLRDAVLTELTFDSTVAEGQIGVAVEDGIVTLTGNVDSVEARVAAERAVKRVEGVRSIADDLHVKFTGERTDTDIARDALHRLRNNVAVPPQVQVVVSDGFVTLDGIVSWLFQRTAAENAVRHLRGVKGFANEITLRSVPALAEPVA